MTSNSSTTHSIPGSIGSRIRLLFGDSGSHWLLLLNEENGPRKYQTSWWNNIPNAVINQIYQSNSQGRSIQEIDFGPNDTWFMNGVNKSNPMPNFAWWNTSAANVDIEKFAQKPDFRASFGSRCNANNTEEEVTFVFLLERNKYWANCNPKLLHRLDQIQKINKDINFVRLFHLEGYFISDSEGTEWCGVPEQCGKELQRWNQVEEVAIAKDGSWIVIFPNHFTCSDGVDERLKQTLQEFFTRQQSRSQQRSEDIARYHFWMIQEKAQHECQRQEQVILNLPKIAGQNERQRRVEVIKRAQWKQKEAAKRKAKRKEMEARLEQQVWEEAKNISCLESHLQNQKLSLKDMVTKLPPERRPCLEDSISPPPPPPPTTTTTKNDSTTAKVAAAATVAQCVICYDANAVKAIIPCGHHCLCDDCSKKLASQRNRRSRLCPICRGPIQRLLKIYTPQLDTTSF